MIRCPVHVYAGTAARPLYGAWSLTALVVCLRIDSRCRRRNSQLPLTDRGENCILHPLTPSTEQSNSQPDDLVKQSLPFSYMAVSAASNDGVEHSVQVYTDISGEWITGDTALVANWSTSTATDETIIHAIQLRDQLEFQEASDRIKCESSFQHVQQLLTSCIRRLCLPRLNIRKRDISDWTRQCCAPAIHHERRPCKHRGHELPRCSR